MKKHKEKIIKEIVNKINESSILKLKKMKEYEKSIISNEKLNKILNSPKKETLNILKKKEENNLTNGINSNSLNKSHSQKFISKENNVKLFHNDNQESKYMPPKSIVSKLNMPNLNLSHIKKQQTDKLLSLYNESPEIHEKLKKLKNMRSLPLEEYHLEIISILYQYLPLETIISLSRKMTEIREISNIKIETDKSFYQKLIEKSKEQMNNFYENITNNTKGLQKNIFKPEIKKRMRKPHFKKNLSNRLDQIEYIIPRFLFDKLKPIY